MSRPDCPSSIAPAGCALALVVLAVAIFAVVGAVTFAIHAGHAVGDFLGSLIR